MAERERRVSENSLANLKLGAESRRLGKLRHNFTILPETIQWLKGTGNASDTIDALVEAARTGGLTPNNTHDWREKEQTVSSDVYNQTEALKLELEQVRSQLEISRAVEKNSAELVQGCYSNGFKVAELLKEAIRLKKAKKGGYLEKVQEAYELVADI